MTLTALQQRLTESFVPLVSGRGGIHGLAESTTSTIEPVLAQSLPTEFDQEMIQAALEQFAGSAGFLVGGGIILAYFAILEPVLNWLQEEDEESDTGSDASADTESSSDEISGVSTTPSAAAKTTNTSTKTESDTAAEAPIDAPSAMTSTATTASSAGASTNTASAGASASTGASRESAATDGGVRTAEDNLLKARRETSISRTETSKSTVVRTRGESETPPLGAAESYELRRDDGTLLALTVAPVLGTGTDTLAHDDDSVLETLGELVDAAERAGVSLAGADSQEYADDLADEYGLWIHDISRVRRR